jgi:hypothetical protein
MNHHSASEDDAYSAPPEDVYSLLDAAPVAVPVTAVISTIETLQHFEEFFRRHASAAVQAELRAFCAAQGWHGVCGAEALLDNLGFNAGSLRHALHAVEDRAATAQDPR